MRKIIVMIAAVLTFAMVATATDFPTSELFLGYNFTRFYPDSAFIPDLNANGGNAQFTYNFDKWIGATVDVGSVTKGTINHAAWDTTVTSFTLGPRFTYHNHSHFTPYFEVLFGGSEASISTEAGTVVGPSSLPARLVLPPTFYLYNPHRGFQHRVCHAGRRRNRHQALQAYILPANRLGLLLGADAKRIEWKRYQP